MNILWGDPYHSLFFLLTDHLQIEIKESIREIQSMYSYTSYIIWFGEEVYIHILQNNCTFNTSLISEDYVIELSLWYAYRRCWVHE